MRALSIRQPYAELILRGTCGQQIKPIEFSSTSLTAGRSRPTKRIGERFYIYASQQWAEGKLLLEGCRPVGKFEERNSNDETKPNAQFPTPNPPIIADNIEVPTEGPQPWMLELAKMLILKDLPKGLRNRLARSTSVTCHSYSDTCSVDGPLTTSLMLAATRLTSMSLSRIEFFEVSRLGLRLSTDAQGRPF